MKILFGSSNEGKLADVRSVASVFGVHVIGLKEIVAAHPELGCPPEVPEITGTYKGNARVKLEAYLAWSNMPCVVDDSGLELAALQGGPGVETAHFVLGGVTPYQKILDALSNTDNRQAKFYSVMVFQVAKDTPLIVAEGAIMGRITHAPRGTRGWGQEPIFEIDDPTVLNLCGKTIAEVRGEGFPLETHRTRAASELFRKLAEANIC